jgi:hypothetical protein
MENVGGAFLLLGVGELMCIIVFFAELRMKRLLHNRNENHVFHACFSIISAVYRRKKLEYTRP